MHTMYTTWMGIDPGLHGGIAVQFSNKRARALVMPLTNGKLDLGKISTAIDDILDHDITFGYRPTLVYIEDVHAMPNQGVTSMFNFGWGVGALHGILTAKGLTVNVVNPIRWKNKVLKDPTKDKMVAIEYCQGKFPYINLLPTPRSKKLHDGMADALCISEYARLYSHLESTTRKPFDIQKRRRGASSRLHP